jgi:hypothetical protein
MISPVSTLVAEYNACHNHMLAAVFITRTFRVFDGSVSFETCAGKVEAAMAKRSLAATTRRQSGRQIQWELRTECSILQTFSK